MLGSLRKRPDVLGGKPVNVSIVQGNIHINLQGITRQDANKGETVRIKLLHNNESVMAKVTGKQSVSII